MTTFKHKTQPIEISYCEYSKLSDYEKQNFIICNDSGGVTVNNNSNTDDILGIGRTAEAIVLAPIAIFKGIFG